MSEKKARMRDTRIRNMVIILLSNYVILFGAEFLSSHLSIEKRKKGIGDERRVKMKRGMNHEFRCVCFNYQFNSREMKREKIEIGKTK